MKVFLILSGACAIALAICFNWHLGAQANPSLAPLAPGDPEPPRVYLNTAYVAALERLPNVHLLGRKPYGALPAYCKGFDVALMPFHVNELTLNANPLKAREYLAAGLQVVSTAIPEVEALGLCRIGRDREGFLYEVERALLDPGPSVELSEAVRGESWEARHPPLDAAYPRQRFDLISDTDFFA